MNAAPTRVSLLLTTCGLALTGCHKSLPATDCESSPPTAPGQSVCTVPGFADRDFILRLPSAFDGKTPLPLVFSLHGGGGSKEGMNKLTCEGGDEAKPSCMFNAAEAHGVILVVPDGTANKLKLRSWNAGGSAASGTTCLFACQQGVDDTSYFHALIDHVRKLVPVDEKRIFFTGFSDGGAMTNRIGCELADTVAAIAPVSGANQLAFGGGTCAPARPIPVLHTHGKADPCWHFDGGPGTCPGQPDGDYAPVLGSVVGTVDKPGWAFRNGCAIDMPTTEMLPDTAMDSATSTREAFTGCKADVELVTVAGGGHTWPGGQQYLSADTVGLVTLDFSASERALAFFEAHPLP